MNLNEFGAGRCHDPPLYFFVSICPHTLLEGAEMQSTLPDATPLNEVHDRQQNDRAKNGDHKRA